MWLGVEGGLVAFHSTYGSFEFVTSPFSPPPSPTNTKSEMKRFVEYGGYDSDDLLYVCRSWDEFYVKDWLVLMISLSFMKHTYDETINTSSFLSTFTKTNFIAGTIITISLPETPIFYSIHPQNLLSRKVYKIFLFIVSFHISKVKTCSLKLPNFRDETVTIKN